MCGIVGMAGAIGGKEETALKQLLIVDSLRGVDSTGVAVIPRTNGDPKIAKQVGNPFELMEHKTFERAMAGANRAIIGHNRFGTVGGASRANAHPFDFETVVGVHNGTISNKHRLDGGNDFVVDSAAIFNHIDKHGVKDVVDKVVGAYCLVWWDKYTDEINFIRNSQRPLWMVYSEDEKNLFWASEYWMLSSVLSRNDIKFGKIEQLPVDTHVRVHVDLTGSLSKASATVMEQPFFQNNVQTQTGFHGTNHQITPPIVKPKLTGVPSMGGAPKNNGVVPVTTVSNVSQTKGSPNFLSGSKGVSLEILSHCENDGWGGSYLSCFSEQWKYASIRWYYPRNTVVDDYIGEFIIADIGPRIDRGAHPSFYKVVSSSVKMIEDVGDPVAEVVEEESTIGELFPDSRGRMIDEIDWLNKHGTCDWCSDVVRPQDPHAFSSAGQVFCRSCMKSDDVKEYAHLTTVKA